MVDNLEAAKEKPYALGGIWRRSAGRKYSATRTGLALRKNQLRLPQLCSAISFTSISERESSG
jgi:hypothetical protein|tara:strand:- start:41958 stop:42146 length:189 start_codon:yes stop_codon:yes gene_type:complete